MFFCLRMKISARMIVLAMKIMPENIMKDYLRAGMDAGARATKEEMVEKGLWPV